MQAHVPQWIAPISRRRDEAVGARRATPNGSIIQIKDDFYRILSRPRQPEFVAGILLGTAFHGSNCLAVSSFAGWTTQDGWAR
jgi:hypothetical protein